MQGHDTKSSDIRRADLTLVYHRLGGRRTGGYDPTSVGRTTCKQDTRSGT